MIRKRKIFSAEFKAKVALEAIHGMKTISELAQEYEVHSNQIGQWKKILVENSSELFDNNRGPKPEDQTELIDNLYRQIGMLQVENEWQKKSLNRSVSQLREIKKTSELSIQAQCSLINLSRSSYYYKPTEIALEQLWVMNEIDRIYTGSPFYGSPRITAELNRWGYLINHKRIELLMRKMGLQAIFPGRNLSRPDKENKIYPYLLKGLDITRRDQVWSSDITYIPLYSGFAYMTAVIDWLSRYVLSWEISTTLDTGFCLSTLERALRQGKPEIFNTDQGSQFTSNAYTSAIVDKEIRMSWA